MSIILSNFVFHRATIAVNAAVSQADTLVGENTLGPVGYSCRPHGTVRAASQRIDMDCFMYNHAMTYLLKLIVSQMCGAESFLLLHTTTITALVSLIHSTSSNTESE